MIKGDPDTLILDLIAIPELHLVLGVTDKLIFEFKRNVFSGTSGRDFLASFFKMENITVSGKQEGKLEGNACRKFLTRLDSLEFMLSQCSSNNHIKGLPFIRAMKAFNMVVTSCFGSYVQLGWQDCISEFTQSYKALQSSNDRPVTVTPKV